MLGLVPTYNSLQKFTGTLIWTLCIYNAAQCPQGPLRSKGLTPSTSFRDHREGAPHGVTQGGHPDHPQARSGDHRAANTWLCGGQSRGPLGSAGPSLRAHTWAHTGAPQALAASAKLLPPTMPQHPSAIVVQKHFLPPRSLTAFIMITPGFWVSLPPLCCKDTKHPGLFCYLVCVSLHGSH